MPDAVAPPRLVCNDLKVGVVEIRFRVMTWPSKIGKFKNFNV